MVGFVVRTVQTLFASFISLSSHYIFLHLPQSEAKRHDPHGDGLASTLAFEASTVFNGPRKGMEFKQGSRGLGYYQTTAARVAAETSDDGAVATAPGAATAAAAAGGGASGEVPLEPSAGTQKDSPKNGAAPGPAAWGVGEEKRSQQVC